MNIHSGGGDAPNTLSPVYSFFNTKSFPKADSILPKNPINSPNFGCAIRIDGNRTSAITFRVEPVFAHVTEPLMHSGPLAEVFSMPFWKSYPGGNATDHFMVMVRARQEQRHSPSRQWKACRGSSRDRHTVVTRIVEGTLFM